MDLFYKFVWAVGSTAFISNSKPVILHRERARRAGPYILAPTHFSPYDVPVLIRNTPRILDFVSIVEVFRNPLAAWFLGSMGAFPLDRAKPDSPTVRIILGRLQRGRVIAMFPEGHVRTDQTSVLAGGPLKPGVFRIAKLANVPIVPCVVLGTRAYHKLKSWMPLRRTRYGITYGEPIDPGRAFDDSDQPRIESQLRAAYLQLHAELRQAMGEGKQERPTTISSVS